MTDRLNLHGRFLYIWAKIPKKSDHLICAPPLFLFLILICPACFRS
jgi:hypothetical protein